PSPRSHRRMTPRRNVSSLVESAWGAVSGRIVEVSFLLDVVAVMVAVHLYLYRRLVRDVARTRRTRGLGALGVLVLMASSLAAFGLGRVLNPTGRPARLLTYVGYTWLVLALYLALMLAVVELPRLFLRRRMVP